MTLNTSIYVVGEIDAHDAYTKANALLLDYLKLEGKAPPAQITFYDKQRERWDSASKTWVPGDEWAIGNQIDQGLPALLDVEYKPHGPLRTQAESDECEDYCDADCDKLHHDPPCWVEVSYDTAYSYRSSLGGCGDLHARLVHDFGRWLEEQGVSEWGWRNEFTGEKFLEPYDRYAQLRQLITGGSEAQDWFRTKVLPAIAVEMSEGVRRQAADSILRGKPGAENN